MKQDTPDNSVSDCPVAMSAVGTAGRVSSTVLSLPSDAIPGYEIRERIGEGGMGTVWRALQISTQREVALKTIGIAAFGTRAAGERFAREIKLAAALEHPHIARVYDGGLNSQVLYFAMELISGKPLDEFVASHRLDRRKVIQLMCVICDAIAYLHGEGIVHRDLKPSNILVDDAGQPHVLDFGLARELGQEGGISIQGEISGTLDYMSPEQARGEIRQVDTRSDVFSLGLLLYRILTGSSPREMSGSPLDVLTRIASQDISLIRGRRNRLERDLEAILTKALSRDRAQRYYSADLLANDLRCYLAGRPVSARRVTHLYVLGRFISRNRIVLSAMLLIALLVASTFWASYVRIMAARDGEEQRRVIAERRLAASLLAEGDALGSAARWVEAQDRYQRSYEVSRSLGDSTTASDVAMMEALGEAPPPLVRLVGHGAPIVAMAFNAVCQSAISVDTAGDVLAWDVPRGRIARRFRVGGQVASAAFAPDGRTLFVALEGKIGEFWHVSDAERLGWIVLEESKLSTAVSSDSKSVAFGGESTIVKLWDATTGGPVRRLKAMSGHITALAFSPDGQHLLAGDSQRIVQLYRLADEQVVRTSTLVQKSVLSAAFSPEGDYSIHGGMNGGVGIVDTRDPQNDLGHNWHASGVIAVGNWGSQVVSVSADGQARVFNAREGLEGSSMSLARSAARAAISIDGIVLIAHHDRSIEVMTVDSRSEVGRLGADEMVRSVDITGSGFMVAHAARNGVVKVRDRVTRRPLRYWEVDPSDPVNIIRFSPDELELWVGTAHGRLTCWSLSTGQVTKTLTGLTDIRDIAFSSDGKFVAAISGSAVARWQRESCQLLQMIRSPRTLAWGMHLSADGSSAWGVSETHGQFCRFDFKSGRVTLEGVERKRITGGPHFLGNDTAAVAFEEHLLRIVVSAQDPAGRQFDGHTHQVLGLAASADGRRMFSACLDRTLGFWDIERGSLVRRVRGAQWGFTQVRCDRQGLNLIASEDQASRARTWDLNRPATYRSMGAAVTQAQLRLAQDANDPESLRAVGQWYEFRGKYDWAHALLSAVVERGESVDPQVMARCNWMMGHRAATREWLERALSVEAEPRRAAYLRIWRDSLDSVR